MNKPNIKILFPNRSEKISLKCYCTCEQQYLNEINFRRFLKSAEYCKKSTKITREYLTKPSKILYMCF